ncbi:MAG: two-component system, NtrC family, sensor histidine kinase AtoS [Verrucomicrobiota bacterium]|jgi:nitrogen-specific signal transduction histidine kinase|nr:two-component system, NtrC family, sensor histidine kinase AtoS [Verrucomicrobiota bacterium]MDK2963993.1 two-component system, NtrC family, sensor histidine kinase AtoS [Verrucomicrobiota bacterium]
MSDLPVSIVYTQDHALLQRICGYLHSKSDVRHVEEPSELKLLLLQHHSVLLFIDLCGAECLVLLSEISRESPDTVTVALGSVRSEPGRQAALLGVYAVEPGEIDRIRLQTLFSQAQAHLHLQQENRVLKEELQHSNPPVAPSRENRAPSLYHFSGAFRRFDNVGIMMERLVEGVASCARVSRVAVFAITPAELYLFRAGVKCMEETRSLEFSRTHSFVQWLQLHAHSISRSMLRYIESVDERLLLERILDLTGSEAILPLFGRKRLIGWLCLGRSSSGVPFEPQDIEELALLAEQVSVTIENSLLHESIAVQKALAENLLQSIPIGIIAAGADGTVCWFNSGAEILLNVSADGMIGRPVERLSSFVASLLNRCLAGERIAGPVEWTEPLTRRDLSIQARRLQQNGQCMGAMAVLNDLTEERILREKQNNLERARFWTDLAAAISHEVRNPLVAISTFSQLLPERYADEEFRTQFRDLTTQEVGRLNQMIDQLDEFANPPLLRFAPVKPSDLIETALYKVRDDKNSTVDVTVEATADIPLINGDLNALSDSIARLLHNAFTAVEGVARPRIVFRIYPGEIGAGRPAVVIEVRDNGPGISPELREKVFSPFCTTKSRGVGLGLPIVRRTMIDHGGLVFIDSGETGTAVRLVLPVWENRNGAGS